MLFVYFVINCLREGILLFNLMFKNERNVLYEINEGSVLDIFVMMIEIR